MGRVGGFLSGTLEWWVCPSQLWRLGRFSEDELDKLQILMVFYGIMTRTAGENSGRLWFEGWSSSIDLMSHGYTRHTLEGLRRCTDPYWSQSQETSTVQPYAFGLYDCMYTVLFVLYGIFYVWYRLDDRILYWTIWSFFSIFRNGLETLGLTAGWDRQVGKGFVGRHGFAHGWVQREP